MFLNFCGNPDYRMRIAMLGFDFVGHFTNLLCVLQLTSWLEFLIFDNLIFYNRVVFTHSHGLCIQINGLCIQINGLCIQINGLCIQINGLCIQINQMLKYLYYLSKIDQFFGLYLYTVNSEIFARNLFLRIALKDIFWTFKIWDLDMIYLHQ